MVLFVMLLERAYTVVSKSVCTLPDFLFFCMFVTLSCKGNTSKHKMHLLNEGVCY